MRSGARDELAGGAVQRRARWWRGPGASSAGAAVKLELAGAAVGDREFLAQPGDLGALALVVVQRGAQSRAQRGVACALADGQTRRRERPAAARSASISARKSACS